MARGNLSSVARPLGVGGWPDSLSSWCVVALPLPRAQLPLLRRGACDGRHLSAGHRPGNPDKTNLRPSHHPRARVLPADGLAALALAGKKKPAVTAQGPREIKGAEMVNDDTLLRHLP